MCFAVTSVLHLHIKVAPSDPGCKVYFVSTALFKPLNCTANLLMDLARYDVHLLRRRLRFASL